jgi:Skp family chaperone for outer membrane proteins
MKLSILLAAGALALALGGALAARAGDGAAPARIGEVDVAAAFKAYRKTAQLEENINLEREQLKGGIDELCQRAEALEQTLRAAEQEKVPEETAKAKEALDVAKARVVAAKERCEATLKAHFEEDNLAILNDLARATAAVGEEGGYNLILRKGEGPTVGKGLDSAMAALSGVLFRREVPAVDLTDAVVARVNSVEVR